LADRFIVHDDAAYKVRPIRCGKKQLPIIPAALGGGDNLQRFETFRQGAYRLLGGENSFAISHQCSGDCLPILQTHVDLHVSFNRRITGSVWLL
jgi:hypothetical protein